MKRREFNTALAALAAAPLLPPLPEARAAAADGEYVDVSGYAPIRERGEALRVEPSWNLPHGLVNQEVIDGYERAFRTLTARAVAHLPPGAYFEIRLSMLMYYGQIRQMAWYWNPDIPRETFNAHFPVTDDANPMFPPLDRWALEGSEFMVENGCGLIMRAVVA